MSSSSPAPKLWATMAALIGWHLLGGALGAVGPLLQEAGHLPAIGAEALIHWLVLGVLLVPVLWSRVAPEVLRPPMRRKLLVPVVLAGVVAANQVLTRLLEVPVSGTKSLATEAMAADPAWLVLKLLAIALGAPVIEELFYRGWLWQRLASYWPPAMVALFTGAAFALAHAQYAVSVLPLTVGLTLLRLSDGGIRSAMALHMAMNVLAVAAMLAA